MFSYFVNPWMLAALSGLSIPLIIEWLFRRRRRQVELPTIRFLLKNPEEKKFRRQDLILLLLRCSAPPVLALALARPLLSPELAGAVRKHHIAIVMDATLSMGQQSGASTAFGLSRKRAAELVRALPKGSLVSLVVLGQKARIELNASDDLYAARERLEALPISHGGTPMADALELAEQCLTAAEQSSKEKLQQEVYIFSDFQKSTWVRKSGGGADPAKIFQRIAQLAESTLVDAGGTRQFNYYFTDLSPDDPLLVAGRNTTFHAVLEAKGPPPPGGATAQVSFLIDGEKKSMQDVSVQGGRADVSFEYRFSEPGEHLIEAQVEGDSHRLDNRRFYLASVPDQYKVLIIDEAAEDGHSGEEGRFLEAAIAPRTRPGIDRFSVFGAVAVHPGNAIRENFNDYCAVVVLGMERVNADLAGKLEPFVRDGGQVVFFLGSRVNAYEYNEKFFRDGKGPLPGKIESVQSAEPPVTLSLSDGAHPLLKNLQGLGELKGGEISRFTALSAAGDAIASYSNGKAAIVEKQFGRGRAIAFTCAGGPPENFLAAHPAHLPLIQELFTYLAGNPDRTVNRITGQPYEADVLVSAQHVILRKPDNSKTRLTPLANDISAAPGAAPYRISFDGTDQMGAYELDAQAGALRRARFVVNLTAEEGDLDRFEEGELRSLLGGSLSWAKPSAPLEDRVRKKYSALELALPFLWIMAGLLALESFLATRFGRRRA